MRALQRGEAGLGGRELRDGDRRLLGVEVERRAVLGVGRREAVERPVARPHGVLHVGHRLRHVDAVGDAGRIGDDEARPGPRLGLDQRLRGLGVVGADRDLGDVDVAVGAGDRAQVLLADALARCRELRDRAAGGGLRRLAAGVRVHLGVEHEDVDVPSGRQHVVEAAEADVVGPPVATDDPDALAHERVGDRRQLRRPRRRCSSVSCDGVERASQARRRARAGP